MGLFDWLGSGVSLPPTVPQPPASAPLPPYVTPTIPQPNIPSSIQTPASQGGGILSWLGGAPGGGSDAASLGMNRLGLLGAALQDAGDGGRGQRVAQFYERAQQAQAKQKQEAVNKAVRDAYSTGDMNKVRQALVEAASSGADISHITQALQFGQPRDVAYGAGQTVYSQDPLTGNLTEKLKIPEKPTPNQPFNADGTPNTAYQEYEKSLRKLSNSGANTGNVQSVQPLADGTLLIVRRDGTTAHVTADGNVVTGARFDPNNKFRMEAAGSAGKAAGTAAESFPTVTANFDLINKTLAGFDGPNVKAQAGKSVGLGSYLPTIPGVNSDFRARQGQLQGQAFLQAFNTLRGGGQITEVEGEKATNAITRLQKAQTPDEFYSALRDAKSIFAQLYASAQQRAQRGAVVPALRIPSAAPQAPAAPKAPTVSNW